MGSFIITGGTGFIGENLIKYLRRQIDNFIVNLNLREELPKLLPCSDVVIHLAGKAHDLKNTTNSEDYFNVNFYKTKELFDLYLKSDIRDFIYFSSVKAVADIVNGILNEDVSPNPQTPYGQSKLKAEEYILGCDLPDGKRVFVLRPSMIHGPGNKGNLNLLYKFILTRIPYPLAAFQNERSFLSIANLNYIIERIVSDISISGGVYNLADDETLSTNQLINVISETIGLKPKLWRINQSLITSTARIGDILHLPLNSERLKKLTDSYVVDNNKIKGVLNIKHLPVTAKEGLSATIRSFQSIQ